MNTTNDVKSRIANGFFLNKQFEIERRYEQTIRTRYGAKVEALDFSKAEEAAKVIDDFISKTTEGKIHDMVTEGTVQGILAAVLYYYKGLKTFRHLLSKRLSLAPPTTMIPSF
ncbi:hypothetical protein TELCIR_06591 [Teladorsagia circumcincta]|uniref:Serpin domain-containing protein n=1 Tax=Teladorsagia circumcincta TaxID=45464 RepID=A0A2G9UMX7_TELCI|nr:hypothetical protein TELCIR_06591 [Teladorsagia circumcincta]